MKIDSVDFFYLAMPVVTTAGDGSQDALVVRVSAGGHVGWGECEASPLTSIAAFVCPMSHGACRPVAASVLGETLDGPKDIQRIADAIAYNCMDLLQAPHTWSGIEVALWDLLGRARGEPAWRLLGWKQAHAKTPYASVLFGDTADDTLKRAKEIRSKGFRAAKFGWGPFGASLEADIAQIEAARAGLGADGILLVDAGQIFAEDAEAAAKRLPALQAAKTTWFEEPFGGFAYDAYRKLAERSGSVKLAGGEAAHNRHMALHLIEYGKVGFVQIDCGRIGGLGPAKQVADHAAANGITYVNHTFTSNLALSASLQPYAGMKDSHICEYPTGLSRLATELTTNHLTPNAQGQIDIPDAPGLGIEINPVALKAYAVDVEIKVNGKTIFAPAGI